MKRFFLAALCLFTAGCTQINLSLHDDSEKAAKQAADTQPEQILVCTNEAGTTRFRATGDEITSTVYEFTRSLEDLQISEDLDKQKIMDAVNASLADQYGDLQGVDVSAKLEENQVRYTLTINYLIANIDKLIEQGILQSGTIENQHVSLNKTKSEFENSGYSCTLD